MNQVENQLEQMMEKLDWKPPENIVDATQDVEVIVLYSEYCFHIKVHRPTTLDSEVVGEDYIVNNEK